MKYISDNLLFIIYNQLILIALQMQILNLMCSPALAPLFKNNFKTLNGFFQTITVSYNNNLTAWTQTLQIYKLYLATSIIMKQQAIYTHWGKIYVLSAHIVCI